MDPRFFQQLPPSNSSKKLSKKKQLRIKENFAIFQKLIVTTFVIHFLFLARFLILNRKLVLKSWWIPHSILSILQLISFFLLYRFGNASSNDVASLKETKGTYAEILFDIVHIGWVIHSLCMVTGSLWAWTLLIFIPVEVLWKVWGYVKQGWALTKTISSMASQSMKQK